MYVFFSVLFFLYGNIWYNSSSSTALLYKPVDRVTRSTLVLHVSPLLGATTALHSGTF